MREILFRGKRCDNGEWVEGTPFQEYNNFWGEWLWIIQTKHPLTNVPYLHLEIDRKTISQFTGLADKNGKRVFEGDIVRGRHWTSYYNKNPEDFHSWRVDWSEKSGLITFVDSPTTKARLSIHDFADFGEVEVIGNIHDNPELLGVVEDG